MSAIFILVNVWMVALSKPVQGAAEYPICGDYWPAGECLTTCYKGCITMAASTTDAKKLEEIGTQKNLCVNKCFGIIYKPYGKYNPKDFPTYAELKECLGVCAYPGSNTKECMQGYLSSYFFCDCVQCCNKTGEADKMINRCRAGCSHWYLRQWSPLKGEGCRYRPDYMKTPNSWCSAYCTWSVMKRESNTDASTIPKVTTSDSVQRCKLACSKGMQNGAEFDYDKPPSGCDKAKLWQCIKSAKASSFKLLTSITDDMIKSAKKDVKLTDITMFEVMSEHKPATSVVKKSGKMGKDSSKGVKHTWILIYPKSLEDMQKSGVSFESERGAEYEVDTTGVTIADPFPKDDIGYILSTAFNSNLSLAASRARAFKFEREMEIDQCYMYQAQISAKMATDIILDFEVHLKISDTEGMFPLKADDLKKAIKQAGWNDLEFVKNIGDYTILVKARVTAGTQFHTDSFIDPKDEKCQRMENVDCKKAKQSDNACRCKANCKT